jgi:hypothetical protein
LTTPILKALAPELLPLVAEQVLGLGLGLMHDTSQEGADVLGIGLLLEDGKAHGAAGEVIDHHGHPVTEGPALGQAEGEPGGPEAQLSGNQSEIDMPNVIDPLGRDHPLGSLGGSLLDLRHFFGDLGRCCLLLSRVGVRIFLENAADGGGAQMEPGSAKYLSDLLLSQERAESLEPLDEVANAVGELVDRLTGLYQGFGSCLIDSPHPGADGVGRHQKYFGSRLQRPTSGGTQFEDRHTLGGWVVRSPLGVDLRHPDILDAYLLATQGHFLLEAVALGFQPNPLVGAIGRPTATVGQGILTQSDDVQDSGFDVSAPAFGERDFRLLVLAGHFRLQGRGFL